MVVESAASKSANTPQEEELSKSMEVAIHDFVQNVDSLRSSFPDVTGAIIKKRETCRDSFRSFVLTNSLGKPREDNHDIIEPVSPFPREHLQDYRRLTMEMDRARRGYISISRSFLVSLVSVFDLFMASVFRFVLLRQPAILNAKETMTFERLNSFESIEKARLFVINREVDSQLRESRAAQFKWLENILKIKLRGEDDLWAAVIELEQRRNTFVHCDGLVTEDYLLTCRLNKAQLPKEMVVGNTLLNSSEYFDHACRAVMEIGIKVAQVIWRKLLSKDVSSDKQFINFCFDRIVQGEFGLAVRALRFAQNEPAFKYHSEDAEFRNLLNLAQAHKWLGDEKACSETLGSRDFTATKPLFRLSKACLEDNVPEALKLVEEIGAKCPDVEPQFYRDWPIFRTLRESPEFPPLFERLFGKPLLVAETVDLKPQTSE